MVSSRSPAGRRGLGGLGGCGLFGRLGRRRHGRVSHYKSWSLRIEHTLCMFPKASNQ